jgi:hypothetical protein
MPKNQVSDLITDQEMAFGRLVLSGTMTDRDAAQAAGLNPDTAAYTKAKPRVRDYMLEHRAAMQKQLLDQESDRLRRHEQRREQVLDRLWEIAGLGPEITRGSITGQVKALSMIVAIEGLIPDRRAGSSERTTAPPRQEKSLDPQRAIAQEDEPGLAGTETTSGSVGHKPPATGPTSDPGESAIVNPFSSSETPPAAFYAPAFFAAPDTGAPFSIKGNPFVRRR